MFSAKIFKGWCKKIIKRRDSKSGITNNNISLGIGFVNGISTFVGYLMPNSPL